MPKESKKILVTGGAGSGGSYLLEQLVERNPELQYFSLVRNEKSLFSNNLRNISNKISIVFCDLLNKEKTAEVINAIGPNQIYHMASNANVLQSFENPALILENNILGTINLFEACRLANKKPRVLLCSTSEVYGQVNQNEVPIRETNALRPASPYAVSKTTQDLLAAVYDKNFGVPIIRTRMFSYINPRRKNLFSTAFAIQLVNIENGIQNELKHGNLDSVRTHMDVRDVVVAYAEVMQNGMPGEVYNMGGTQPFTVEEFLHKLIKRAKVPIRTRRDESLLRPTDVTLQIPDTSKFTNLTNWKPKYTLEDSINFLLDECRSQINK